MAQTRYKLGLRSIVELSQAQLQQTEAEIKKTNASYQYRLALATLRYETVAQPRGGSSFRGSYGRFLITNRISSRHSWCGAPCDGDGLPFPTSSIAVLLTDASEPGINAAPS